MSKFGKDRMKTTPCSPVHGQTDRHTHGKLVPIYNHNMTLTGRNGLDKGKTNQWGTTLVLLPPGFARENL